MNRKNTIVIAVFAVALFLGGLLGWSIRSRRIYAMQGYTLTSGSGWSHPSSEVYARVNAEANVYLRELISNSSLGWDLSDPKLGDMCHVIPVSNAYNVVFWCGNAEREIPDDIISKLSVFLKNRFEKETEKTQQTN